MGIVIQGREITSADEGKFLVVVRTNSNTYLPLDYKAEITNVSSDYVTLRDNGGSRSYYDIGEDELGRGFEFELGKGFKQEASAVKSTASQRKKLAKAVKEARKDLEDCIKDAESVGMEVKGFGQEINFQPPLEKY